MTFLQRLAAIALPVVLAVVIGCGGGGSSSNGSGGSPDALTRQQVKDGFGQSLIALAQSGMSLGAGGGAGTSGGSNGGAGVPFVGAYVRQFLPGFGGLARIQNRDDSTGGNAGTTGGTSAGNGGGGGEGPTLYFDEYLGLWAEWTWSGNEYSTHLFEDEAKTKPAGSFVNTFDDQGNYTSTFEITAGPFAGAHGQYRTTILDDVSGQSTYDNTWPTWGHDEGISSWSEDGSEWQHRSEMPDGSWYESQGSFEWEGGGTASGSDSLGYRYQFTYNPDGSGRGRVEGPRSGLPATITWRADGFTRIVWADGTVEEFDPSDWFGEGGTTGEANTGGTGAALAARG